MRGFFNDNLAGEVSPCKKKGRKLSPPPYIISQPREKSEEQFF
jgi:hypothetical protein